MQLIFITPIHKVFNLLYMYSASSLLLIFPTRSVSAAKFTKGHDLSVLLQSAVYSKNRKDAKTVPWCAPVFGQITDDSAPFSCKHCSLLVRYQWLMKWKMMAISCLKVFEQVNVVVLSMHTHHRAAQQFKTHPGHLHFIKYKMVYIEENSITNTNRLSYRWCLFCWRWFLVSAVLAFLCFWWRLQQSWNWKLQDVITPKGSMTRSYWRCVQLTIQLEPCMAAYWSIHLTLLPWAV